MLKWYSATSSEKPSLTPPKSGLGNFSTTMVYCGTTHKIFFSPSPCLGLSDAIWKTLPLTFIHTIHSFIQQTFTKLLLDVCHWAGPLTSGGSKLRCKTHSWTFTIHSVNATEDTVHPHFSGPRTEKAPHKYMWNTEEADHSQDFNTDCLLFVTLCGRHWSYLPNIRYTFSCFIQTRKCSPQRFC